MTSEIIKYNKLAAFSYLLIALLLAIFFTLTTLFVWFVIFDLTLTEKAIITAFMLISILIFVINFKRIWPILHGPYPAITINLDRVIVDFTSSPLEIPTKDIESVKLVMTRKGRDWIGFVLRPSSKVSSNYNLIKKKLAKEYFYQEHNWVVVDMSFIKVSPKELVTMLNLKLFYSNNQKE
jgi:hypothetical protein